MKLSWNKSINNHKKKTNMFANRYKIAYVNVILLIFKEYVWVAISVE
jgi:hypothetical protein